MTWSMNKPTNDDGGNPKKRKKRDANRNRYWDEKVVSDAIIKYNATEDMEIRNELYERYIHAPMAKLCENVFNTFKFIYVDDSPIRIQQGCMGHLIANIEKFDPNKNSKVAPLKKTRAFSYFSICCKHYFIQINQAMYKHHKKFEGIHLVGGGVDAGGRDDDTDSHHVPEELKHTDEHYEERDRRVFMEKLIEYFDLWLPKIIVKAGEVKIGQAVVEILRNHERIDTFNKKSLFLGIREIAGCKTQQINRHLQTMLKHYVELKKEYDETGDIDVSYRREGFPYSNRNQAPPAPVVKDVPKIEVKPKQIHEKTIRSEWIRLCPRCHRRIYYGCKGALKEAKSRNTGCINRQECKRREVKWEKRKAKK